MLINLLYTSIPAITLYKQLNIMITTLRENLKISFWGILTRTTTVLNL